MSVSQKLNCGPHHHHQITCTPESILYYIILYKTELQVLIALRALLSAWLLSRPAKTTTNNLIRVPEGHAAHQRLIPRSAFHYSSLRQSINDDLTQHHILAQDKCIQ